MGSIVHSAHHPLLSLKPEAKGHICFQSQRDATEKVIFFEEKAHASLEKRFAPAFLMLLGSGRRQLIILEYGVSTSECAQLTLGAWCQLEAR